MFCGLVPMYSTVIALNPLSLGLEHWKVLQIKFHMKFHKGSGVETQVPPAVTVVRCALAVKSVGPQQADLLSLGLKFC